MAATEFVKRVSALGGPAMASTDVDFVFRAHHPLSSLMQRLSDSLDACASVGVDELKAYQALLAQNKVLVGDALAAARAHSGHQHQHATSVASRLQASRQTEADLRTALASAKASVQASLAANAQLQQMHQALQQRDQALNMHEADAVEKNTHQQRLVNTAVGQWTDEVQSSLQLAVVLSTWHARVAAPQAEAPVDVPVAPTSQHGSTVNAATAPSLPSPFVSCLAQPLQAYWDVEAAAAGAMERWTSAQFAPGLTRLLLQTTGATMDLSKGATSGTALELSPKTSATADEGGWSLPTPAAVANWSYASLAAEVTRLQSGYLSSMRHFLEASRRERVGRAMLLRAAALDQQHAVVAGWTQTRVQQQLDACRRDTQGLADAVRAIQTTELPNWLARLAPLTLHAIVRKDHELKLVRQRYFLSKLQVALDWQHAQRARLLLVLAAVQAEEEFWRRGRALTQDLADHWQQQCTAMCVE